MTVPPPSVRSFSSSPLVYNGDAVALKPVGLAEGDLLIALCTSTKAGTPTTFDDFGSPFFSVVQDTDSGCSLYAYSKIADAVDCLKENWTLSVQSSNYQVHLYLIAVSGINPEVYSSDGELAFIPTNDQINATLDVYCDTTDSLTLFLAANGASQLMSNWSVSDNPPVWDVLENTSLEYSRSFTLLYGVPTTVGSFGTWHIQASYMPNCLVFGCSIRSAVPVPGWKGQTTSVRIGDIWDDSIN